MKTGIKLLLITALSLGFVTLASAKDTTIFVIAPVEIQAMDEIVSGYKERLTEEYSGKLHFIIKNAQGDINIQRALLQQAKTRHVDIIATIATQPAQMAASIIHDTPIVAVAADIKNRPANMTGVLDEVSITKQIEFIHRVSPDIKKISLVHSASEKVFPEVEEAKKAAAEYGIVVQDLMMQQLSDLYSISKRIDKNSDAIFVLKDAQVVSGMPVLVKVARTRGIPVIASDDGSVANGANYALGVSEKQIGRDGADVTLQLLNGKSPAQVPVFVMKDYLVFINGSATQLHNPDIDTLKAVAKKEGYKTQIVAGQ
jgi:putative tryptophan/tyrosine transport system substrate-binding protein